LACLDLEYYIKERPHGIVLCSMYSLTNDADRRNELLNLALAMGVELHFANELTSLRSRKDLEKIETYLNFAVDKKGLHVWE
jgi:sporadic carbohydrate cluster protein (TIGR04323 family)